MNPEHVALRDALLARNDALLDRWPNRLGPEFVAEMQDVAKGLEGLARAAERAGDDLEANRCWRWAGNAWFDAGAGRAGPSLETAELAYRAAEVALGASTDPVERLKLDYCLGKTLLLLCEDMDPARAQEASRRLQNAVQLAQRHLPEAVAPAQSERDRARQVAALLGQLGHLDDRIDELQAQLQVTPPPATPPSTSPADDGLSAADMASLFVQLNEQVEQARPGLQPDRQRSIDAMMQRLGQRVAASGQPGRDMAAVLASRGQLDTLRRALEPMAKDPTLAGPGWPAGSRGAHLLAALQALKMQVSAAALWQGNTHPVRDAAMDLFVQLGRLTTWVSEAGGDADRLRRLEHDTARALAREVRLFFTRAHTLLAQPVWPDVENPVDVNQAFFAGSDAVRDDLAAALVDSGINLAAAAAPGADRAGDRWRSLRTSGVAVFDLSGADPQVYYELGIALAIGCPLLLLADADTVLPFDIAQDVHRMSPERATRRAALADAVLQVAYGAPQEAGKGSSLAATQAWAAHIAPSSPAASVSLRLMRDALDDPLKFHNALAGFVVDLGVDRHSILQTRWPGDYPNPGARRHFAVMPFRAEREAPYAIIERAAQAAGITPVRGDRAEGQEIIASIWLEICRASAVTVDLSGFNLNVCLELGLADALGRPTLLLGEAGTEVQLAAVLPSVAKRRCLPYARDPASSPSFEAGVRRFFAAV